MKTIYTKIILSLILLFSFFPPNSFGQNSDDVYVNGYYKKNGTYVESHYRTSPNNTKEDNYSTKGNVNPYNGKKGYKTGDEYYSNYNSTYYIDNEVNNYSKTENSNQEIQYYENKNEKTNSYSPYKIISISTTLTSYEVESLITNCGANYNMIVSLGKLKKYISNEKINISSEDVMYIINNFIGIGYNMLSELVKIKNSL